MIRVLAGLMALLVVGMEVEGIPSARHPRALPPCYLQCPHGRSKGVEQWGIFNSSLERDSVNG